MYKLYGFCASNYYNMVKLALMEKGLKFEEILSPPSQEETYLVRSPMGKVPCLETDEGPLIETSVILDYLEDISGGSSFYPSDAYEKAKVKELIKSTELYLELVARRLLGEVFFGAPVNEDLRVEVKADLEKGIIALNKLLKFEPYAAGENYTYADIMLYYSVTLSMAVAKQALNLNLIDLMPGVGEWMKMMNKNPLIQQVNVDRDAALKAMAG